MEQIHHKLIQYFGGQTPIAKHLGISPQAVSSWRERIPRGRLAELAIVDGRRVESLADLDDLPKIWPEISALPDDGSGGAVAPVVPDVGG